MDKKKLRAYFMIFCASVLISIYLPSLIDLCSQRMVDGMVSETVETEAMTESGPGIAGTLPGADREETESGETRNDEGNDSRPGREESEMNPLHTAETDPASTAAEIQKKKEKQDAGLKKFRESFHPEITEAYSGVREALNDEIRCMVRVYTKSGDRNYSQDYIVVYSKAYDFYSVYAYNR